MRSSSEEEEEIGFLEREKKRDIYIYIFFILEKLEI